MIDIQNVQKRFGNVEALRGIDLSMRRGRVTAIVGPNGAGKSTLTRIVLGLVTADAGQVRIDGVPVGDAGDYRSRIGYMPQIVRFPEHVTGDDLLALLRDLRRARGPIDLELFDRFALAPEMGKQLRTLSGGTRQKINAALAFAFFPDLLILDEPTAGLDPASSATLKDKILAERGGGRTIVVTSHIMSDVEDSG